MPKPPIVPGLDADGQQIIDQRWTPVCSFLRQHLAFNEAPAGDSFDRKTLKILGQRFLVLERQVTKQEAADTVTREDGRDQWIRTFLLPLATNLGCRGEAETTLIKRCWQRGYFDQPRLRQRGLERPRYEDVELLVHAILADNPFRSHRMTALLDRSICRDKAAATLAVQELARSGEMAAGQARGIILALIHYGAVGLLMHSGYRCIDELLRLEQWVEHIAQLSNNPEAVLGELRSCIIALDYTLQSASYAKLYYDIYKDKLGHWQHLLHEPMNSPNRRRYSELLTPSLRTLVLTELTYKLGCDEASGAAIVDTLIERGLPGLIAWQCRGHQLPKSTFVLQRVLQVCRPHLQAITQTACGDIKLLLCHLQHAIDETEASISLVSLLRPMPSSPYRRRFGRRIWFGVGASIRRREIRRRRWGKRAHVRREHRTVTVQPSLNLVADQLVAAFARRANLPEQDARTRLRDLVVYGALGLLQQSERNTAVNPSVVDLLEFYKRGPLEHIVAWSQTLARVNDFAASQGIPALSSQVARAVFNNLPKERRWHGGEGEAVASVRQRTSLVLAGVPRLHEAWIVVRTAMNLCLIDNSHSLLSDHCYVVLVLDQGSMLPVGCRVSAEAPSAAEIGMALFQAIWHPGAIDWPLRGIPQAILISDSLAAGAVDLTDLRRAAYWLNAEVQTLPKKHEQVVEIMQKLRVLAPESIRRQMNTDRLTSEQAQTGLLSWLRSIYFPNHRVAVVPLHLRERGFTMPAHNTPVAGWLLPRCGIVTTIRNAIRDGDVVYSGLHFQIAPGIELPKRQLPYFYNGVERGLFVEHNDTLYYLLRSSET